MIVTLEEPIKQSGHIQILYGNLAPEVWPCYNTLWSQNPKTHLHTWKRRLTT